MDAVLPRKWISKEEAKKMWPDNEWIDTEDTNLTP